MSRDNTAPRVNHPKDEPTLWVDYRTGWGIDPAGHVARINPGRDRKNANLVDALNAAKLGGFSRIMYTGNVPTTKDGVRQFLYVNTPGWERKSHWVDGPPTGRFVSTDDAEHNIEVRTAAEWFGPTDLNPREAQTAWRTLWNLTEHMTGTQGQRPVGLMRSPAATGANLWAASLPRGLKLEPTPADIREEIHFTTGQHHIEHLGGSGACSCGDCRPLAHPDEKGKIPGFYYVDGRFMYASVCREIGIGGRRITAVQAADLLFFAERGRYERARYKVRATVPPDWDHIGILPAKREGTMDWHYPNKPGATFETWADAAEVDLALSNHWEIQPLEGILFTKARVMDTYAERITKARAAVAEDPNMGPHIRDALTFALRSVLLFGIGNLASRGRSVEKSAPTLREVPPQYRHEAVQHGKHYVWRERAEVNTAAKNRWYWPELPAQVWGRARARLLSSPTGQPGTRSGALFVPPSSLIGVYGDALMTSDLPLWSLPTGVGGGDDKKVGRLRLVGSLPRPQNFPDTIEDRNRLQKRAQREGAQQMYTAPRGT